MLNSYLVLFLHAARLKDNASQTSAGTPSQFNTAASEVDYKGIVDFILDSKQLGSNVGAAWNVDKVMRWVSAAVSPHLFPRVRRRAHHDGMTA